jgi:hypothetical protein
VLYAYAVENLAKGLLIAKDPKGKSVLKDNGKLDQYFKKHKPGKYVKAAGICLETREKELLDLLGQAARSGKYPIPTDPAHMSDHQKACSLYREEVSAIRKLFNRLDNELRSVAPGNTDPTMESQLNQTV